MNANKLMNMAMRIVMRKAINKSINVGVNKATSVARGQSQPAPVQNMSASEDEQPKVRSGPTQAEIRQRRRAKRAARQARQSAKNGNGSA